MVLQTPVEIEYPESDGKPMGETDLHRSWMMRLYQLLAHRFRGEKVYVSSDLLVYYEEGMPSAFVVPDVFLVKDCAPDMRRVFKIWEEGRVPNVVFEVTSRSTRRADEVEKLAIYERMGVRELFLFDPTGDYLEPRLQGYRQANSGYEPIRVDESGRLASEELDALMFVDDSELQIVDRRSGSPLLTEVEAERRNAEQERQAKEVERRAKEAERQAKEVERQAKEAERQAKEVERQAKEAERQAKEAERQAKETERAGRLAAEAEAARLRQLLDELRRAPG